MAGAKKIKVIGFAGERWTTLHGVNADFCQALAPLGEFFAGSKISRLI
jgi:hypothetical protein